MRPVVFLGPSLDAETARAELDAEYLLPIVRGDIDALLARTEPPPVIGIVDGAFLHSLSISPKEVMRAVDRGIPVFGSSSMGALRAVECVPLGMVGIGRVYEEYATGRVDADDEVAIVYDTESLRPLSEPMINFRIAVADGIAAGRVDPTAGECFLRSAKALYFPQRTVHNALRAVRVELGDEVAGELARYFAEEAPDAKRDDALQLLRAIRDHRPRARNEVRTRGAGVR
jgi:hypothetical protein